MALFTHDLGDGYDLALRDTSTVDAVFALTVANIDRLRLWEPWAQHEPTRESTVAFTVASLHALAEGTEVPCVIRYRGEPVGTISLRIRTFTSVAEIGYWIDAAHEGRGVVTRATRALVDHAFDDLGLARVELHTAAHNARSRGVAERLGFVREGTMRSAHPVGDERHDMDLYALLPSDRT
ncbi:GNAT family N-acetyltransferase [Cnuibacter physcomitrellae]|uniref:GNAT family N-acetyltransferase n=1 Tax=Cnuibacter physcomitrellae TaxID=1619308 RepID=UPI002175BBB7|nr:GNAT family protein [Cnuibacter physcomitrellae]MCS5496345.1 GNAT family N-acetyltransferase [Cnuibacter physcomitrellae]